MDQPSGIFCDLSSIYENLSELNTVYTDPVIVPREE